MFCHQIALEIRPTGFSSGPTIPYCFRTASRYWSSHIINFSRLNVRRAGSCASARLSICQTVSIIRRRRSHVPGMHMDGVTCILVVIFTWVLDKFPQLFSMHLGQRHTGSRESRKAPPSIASPPVAIHQLTTRTVRDKEIQHV